MLLKWVTRALFNCTLMYTVPALERFHNSLLYYLFISYFEVCKPHKTYTIMSYIHFDVRTASSHKLSELVSFDWMIVTRLLQYNNNFSSLKIPQHIFPEISFKIKFVSILYCIIVRYVTRD